MYNTRNYSAVNDQLPDLARREQSVISFKKKFALYNNLPMTINVILQTEDSTTFIGSVDKFSFLFIKPGQIRDGDVFHFMYPSSSGGSTKNYFACPSEIAKLHLGSIVIGSIVSAQGGYNRDIHFNGDISSIRLHNMTAWPVFIYMNNKKVGYIEKNTALGTLDHAELKAAPSIYFDNANKGLKINDVLRVTIVKDEEEVTWRDFKISDRYISEIFIGQNSTQIGAHNKPEVYFYRAPTSSISFSPFGEIKHEKIRLKNDSNTSAVWSPIAKKSGVSIKRYGVINS